MTTVSLSLPIKARALQHRMAKEEGRWLEAGQALSTRIYWWMPVIVEKLIKRAAPQLLFFFLLLSYMLLRQSAKV